MKGLFFFSFSKKNEKNPNNKINLNFFLSLFKQRYHGT